MTQPSRAPALAEAAPGVRAPRVLYVSPLDVTANNGMLQRQVQVLAALTARHPGRVDVLTLHSSPRAVVRWAEAARLDVRVVTTWWAAAARLNALAWYAGNVALCNKLGATRDFAFPVRTPLPRAAVDRYGLVVCYYAWAFLLLGLERAAAKVVVDLGDVMAGRHARIGARRWISVASADEGAILRSGARCVAISDDDRDEFERLYGVRIPVVPFLHSAPGPLLTLRGIPRARAAGFLAARGYGNERVLDQLCDDRFLAQLGRAGVRLVLAGGICAAIDAGRRQRLGAAGATILGRVDDVAGFYRQVGVTVNPVGPSTGAKIKSIEALMAGRALVTTRYGADASLRSAFGADVSVIEWPVDAQALGEATVRALEPRAPLQGGAADDEDRAARYMRAVSAAVDATFGPVRA